MLVRQPPFPGMDPWLECPPFWLDVHNSLCVALRDALVPLVSPRYIVGVETRTTVLGRAQLERLRRADLTIQTGDVATPLPQPAVAVLEPGTELDELEFALEAEIDETFLEIRDGPGGALVTVIELLSPTNKVAPDGRAQYLAKRQEVLRSRTNLVEIDLMRAGTPLPARTPVPASDYRILIGRGDRRPKGALYRFSYKVPIPTIPVPLLPGETEPRLDLTAVLHGQIDRARYYQRVDYGKPPVPPLRPEDTAWAAAILAAARTPEGGAA